MFNMICFLFLYRGLSLFFEDFESFRKKIYSVGLCICFFRFLFIYLGYGYKNLINYYFIEVLSVVECYGVLWGIYFFKKVEIYSLYDLFFKVNKRIYLS